MPLTPFGGAGLGGDPFSMIQAFFSELQADPLKVSQDLATKGANPAQLAGFFGETGRLPGTQQPLGIPSFFGETGGGAQQLQAPPPLQTPPQPDPGVAALAGLAPQTDPSINASSLGQPAPPPDPTAGLGQAIGNLQQPAAPQQSTLKPPGVVAPPAGRGSIDPAMLQQILAILQGGQPQGPAPTLGQLIGG